MKSQKINFKNQSGEMLAARLELPVDSHPHSFALFAHCFTCNKNLIAVRNICRAMTLSGIAVLRFDFTGLGESEGDFENTNFSSNVDDLVSASKFLEENYQAPKILIGHSLGGAAVIFAAHQLPSVKAVATIGAPSSPAHVSHLFKNGLEEIRQKGEALITIGGREFSINKQFIEDLEEKNMVSTVRNLNCSLLVMHSPQDTTVSIENAADIYKAARHPKSFISLDGADHLLSDKVDSVYVGDLIACWVKRYIEMPESETLRTDKQVVVKLGNKGFTTEIMAGRHGLIADEPENFGGNDFGPTPYELVSAGLGACTAITLRMYADRKEWDLKEVIVHLDHQKLHAEDCEKCETKTGKIDHFVRVIEFEANLNEEQKSRLLEIAEKCPVHKTLQSEVVVHTKLKGKPQSI